MCLFVTFGGKVENKLNAVESQVKIGHRSKELSCPSLRTHAVQVGMNLI
jgi:hypothetical protein